MVVHIRSSMGAGRPDGAILTIYDALADINPKKIFNGRHRVWCKRL